MQEPASDDRRYFRALRRLLVGAFLLRGLVYLSVLPLFEGWDEYEHVGYVVHVAETGRPAEPGRTDVPRSLLAELVKYPLPRCVVDLQLGRLGAVGYRDFWEGPRGAGLRPGVMELYEAQHAWWYYRLVSPLFTALGGVGRLRDSVSALRLLNVAFLAMALWIALGTAARLVRNEREAAWIGLAIALHPLFLINGARVANDSLGVLLATLAVAGCLTLRRERWGWQCALIGLAAGLAALAKAVNLALVPFVAAAWLAFVLRERLRPRTAALGALLLAGGFLLVTQHDLRANFARYGGPTPMQEALVNRNRGRTTADLIRAADAFEWDRQVRRLWLRDTFFAGGWSNQGPGSAWFKAYSWTIAGGLAGYLVCVPLIGSRRPSPFRSPATPLLCAFLCAGYTLALAYHMVQSYLAWGKPTTCPWYACAAIPWFLLLAVGGGRCWPAPALRNLVPLGIAAISLATECVVLWTRMIPTYSGGARGWQAVRRLAALHPAWLGTTTLVLASTLLLAVLGRLLALLAHPPVAPALPSPGPSPRGTYPPPPHVPERSARSVPPNIGAD
jgi:4-amino-4-deoxy-L-arabinose transferase-like glycosyltransferase